VYPKSYAGARNDFTQMKANLPLEDIKIPTLIVHGDCDTSWAPFQYSENAVKRIPEQYVKFHVIKGGGHVLWLYDDNNLYKNDLRDVCYPFMKEHIKKADS